MQSVWRSIVICSTMVVGVCRDTVRSEKKTTLKNYGEVLASRIEILPILAMPF